MIEAVRHDDSALFQIDALNIARKEIDVTQHLAHRINNVCNVEIARRDLVQHRRKKKEVVAVYERYRDVGMFPALKLQRSIKTGETTTENEHAGFFVAHKLFIRG